MINPAEYPPAHEALDVERILASLEERLPTVARELIATSPNIEDPRQQDFLQNPDDPAEHALMWHQYGILTHSKEFQKFIADDAPELMQRWSIEEQAIATLSETIDGMSKIELLQIMSLIHDLGKFTSRIFEERDGVELARFIDHEKQSGELVRGGFKEVLKELGLSEAQIEYIAQCAEHHFDLGKVRRVAAANGGYTLMFAKSEAFKVEARSIIDANPELALEIGLMFIADSLSKTKFTATADTDEGIEAQREMLEAKIAKAGVEPLLINQALQQPVNVEIGKQFLIQWALSR
jgi:hypothetical protein